ncbi:hypothetical protein HORM4_610036 [Vibrio harveyi]|nr:hypothetical protein VHARVF571_250070 [Vibrio harveyi]CAK6715259.1 hypothetical protein HORM4_610036 [Vibrio harveyi]
MMIRIDYFLLLNVIYEFNEFNYLTICKLSDWIIKNFKFISVYIFHKVK